MSRKHLSPSDRTQSLFAKFERICRRIPFDCQPDAVHHLRTTIQRIEILAAQVGNQDAGLSKLLKQLIRLRRRAGKLKDIDVQVAALRTVMLESAATDKRLVMQTLNHDRAEAEQKLMAAVRNAGERERKDKLRRVAKELSTAAGTSSARDYASAALDKFAHVLVKYPVLTRDNLHEFRMECKRVRYLAEMSGESANGVVNECKRIQDAVGEWHDWKILTERAEKVLPERNSPLLNVLRLRERSSLAAALQAAVHSKREVLSIRAPRKQARSSPLSPVSMAAAG
jgi:CHAD domain-containing protein